MQNTRPSNQSANSIEAKSPNEYWSVAIMAKNPICMTERGKWICAEISSLKTRRPRSSYAKCVLEMLVQRVEKTVREALFMLAGFDDNVCDTHP